MRCLTTGYLFRRSVGVRIDVAGVQVDETAVLRIVEYEFVGVAGNARICGAEVEFNHSIPEFPAMRPALPVGHISVVTLHSVINQIAVLIL